MAYIWCMTRIAFISRSRLWPAHRYVAGIRLYNSKHGGQWAIEPMLNPSEDELRELHADGVVIYALEGKRVSLIKQHNVPGVAIFSIPEWPAVMFDDVKIGIVAGEFLLKCRRPRILYMGDMDRPWSRERFEGLLRVAHGKVAVDACWCESDPAEGMPRVRATVAEKLSESKLPLAVFATDDNFAVFIEEVCQSMDLRVPEDVAILGVNDSMRAEFAPVPISSVSLPYEKMGWAAAELLSRLIAGEEVPRFMRFGPDGIRERESCNSVASSDPIIAAALSMIRERFPEGINATEVANEIGLTRTALQQRFRRKLDSSVGEELRAIRLSHAKRLLEESDKALTEIAGACGFQSASYFSRAFRKAEGMAPSVYRESLHEQDPTR